MRRPFWTETERGWFAGPYRIQRLAPTFWVLTQENQGEVQVLDSAGSPQILAMTLRPRIHTRTVFMMLFLATSLALLVAGSLLDSMVSVLAAALATCVSILKTSDYLMDPATARHPVSV